jgi:hypothetical protein
MLNNSSLWATPIATSNVDLGEEYNNELVELAKEWTEAKMNKDNLFKHATPGSIMMYKKTPAIKKLFETKIECVTEYLKTNYNLDIDDLGVSMHTFTNHETGGDWSLPHGHHGNQMICTYYPKVDISNPHPDQPKLAGHMLFYPPYAQMPDYMVRNVNSVHAIPLRTGTIVLLPGYILHSTVPFANSNEKYAFVTNIRFSKKIWDGTISSTGIEKRREFQNG